jgi:hypothetical protein
LNARDVWAAWSALDVDRQRAVIKAMFSVEMSSPGKRREHRVTALAENELALLGRTGARSIYALLG